MITIIFDIINIGFSVRQGFLIKFQRFISKFQKKHVAKKKFSEKL